MTAAGRFLPSPSTRNSKSGSRTSLSPRAGRRGVEGGGRRRRAGSRAEESTAAPRPSALAPPHPDPSPLLLRPSGHALPRALPKRARLVVLLRLPGALIERLYRPGCLFYRIASARPCPFDSLLHVEKCRSECKVTGRFTPGRALRRKLGLNSTRVGRYCPFRATPSDIARRPTDLLRRA